MQSDSRKPFLTLETSVSKAFMAEALGVCFDRGYYFDPWLRREADARCHQYAVESLRDLDVLYTESNLGAGPGSTAIRFSLGASSPI